jgi:Lrp/AsnC family leucine-responsive transcriptional regulator
VNEELDEFDLKLLDLIQRNNRLTADELAKHVCLSASSIHRRLRRLRERKVIETEVAIISPEAIGRNLIAIVEVTLESDRPERLERFQHVVVAMPEVMQCYYVTGECDLVLIVTAKSMQDYEKFASRAFSKATHVERFRTLVVMRRMKSGFAFPIEHPRKKPPRS